MEHGLALDQDILVHVGRKSNISKAESEAKKEVQEGKQSTINGVLRAGKTPKPVSK
jgi:hypothetical protein